MPRNAHWSIIIQSNLNVNKVEPHNIIINMLRSISIINLIFNSFSYYIFPQWNHQLKLIVYLFTLPKHMLIFFSETIILCYGRPSSIKWSVSKSPSSVRRRHRRYTVLPVKPPETSSEFPKRFFDRGEPGKHATWSDYVKSRKRSWNPWNKKRKIERRSVIPARRQRNYWIIAISSIHKIWRIISQWAVTFCSRAAYRWTLYYSFL